MAALIGVSLNIICDETNKDKVCDGCFQPCNFVLDDEVMLVFTRADFNDYACPVCQKSKKFVKIRLKRLSSVILPLEPKHSTPERNGFWRCNSIGMPLVALDLY